jgi:hypothetical protein
MDRTLIALMQSSSRDRPDVDELEVDVERGAAAVSVGCDMETFALVVEIARIDGLPHLRETPFTN